VVLVVRNARHSTEAKGTRLTPKEPDRPAAIMPFNACPSSAATGAPRAVKRSRPVGYVALPDAQRFAIDSMRCSAMIKPNQTSRYRTGLDVLGLDVLSLDVLGAAPTGPVRTMAWPGSLARTVIIARRPRSSAIAVGFALQKEIVHRRPWRPTNPASAGCGVARSEVAIAHLGAARAVTRRRVVPWVQARSDCRA